MPEMPVTVDVADTRLSQIKGWKIATQEASTSASLASAERQRRKATQGDKSNKTSAAETSSQAHSSDACR